MPANGSTRTAAAIRRCRWIGYLWALPATSVGLVFVLLAWLSGGRARIVAGVIEVEGGLVAVFMRGLLGFTPASARTLGHVILGLDQAHLESSRIHEHTHVRQYEQWGVLLLPAYLLSSWSARRRGLDPYYDNRFEREAFAAERQSVTVAVGQAARLP